MYSLEDVLLPISNKGTILSIEDNVLLFWKVDWQGQVIFTIDTEPNMSDNVSVDKLSCHDA